MTGHFTHGTHVNRFGLLVAIVGLGLAGHPLLYAASDPEPDSTATVRPAPVVDLDLALSSPPALAPATVFAVADSTPHRSWLLPEHMSIMEQALWGEGGVVRTTGILPLDPSHRKIELSLRRTMLTAHQIGGFATLALMVPTLILGQRNIQNWNDANAGIRPLDRQLNRTHHEIAMITFGTYMATGALAILAPPPLVRRDDWSTVTIHKTLAWVHFTGMVATPILAALAAHAPTLSEARNLRTAHEIAAYTTAAALAASFLVITF